jgi:hypothetical protein
MLAARRTKMVCFAALAMTAQFHPKKSAGERPHDREG